MAFHTDNRPRHKGQGILRFDEKMDFISADSLDHPFVRLSRSSNTSIHYTT